MGNINDIKADAALELFKGEGYVEPKKPTVFCRTCRYREGNFYIIDFH